MVNVTFSLSEDTVKRLRQASQAAAGGRKGAISEFVEAAVLEHLSAVETGVEGEVFRAAKDGRVLASAPSLRALSQALKRLKLDPREVQIVSSAPIEPLARTGLRETRI